MFYGDDIPKILAVDDSIESLNILEKILNPLNIDLICTTSASDALLKASEQNFALALVDIKMDNIDGLELFKMLRSTESTNYLPIILISSISNKNDPLLTQIEEIGGDFILKPIIPEIIRGKIKYLLEQHQQKNKLINQAEEWKRIIKKMTKLSANLENEIKSIKEIEKHIPFDEKIHKEEQKVQARIEKEIDIPTKRIINASNLLLETNLEPKQLELTQKIRNTAEWIQTAINDISDYPKIKNNQLKLNMKNFNLETLIGTTIRILESKAKEKNLKIYCNIDNDVPQNLRGDEDRIKQILKNYCTNAINNAANGEIKINISLQNEDVERCLIYFEVTDNGIGIEDNLQDKLFESVLINDESELPISRGIGLTLVKELTELMGGKCGVKSKKDNGSTFWFTVNLKLQPT